jgi:hypothetical protein
MCAIKEGGESKCAQYFIKLLNFLNDPSKRSSPSFSSTTFQNTPGISDLLFEGPGFSTIQSCAPDVIFH